jgi:prolipoprotein diacylglyceryltransferase
MIGLLASIPSPPVNDFHIGPLRVTFYGIFIMTGVVVAWLVIRHRFAERGGDMAIAERIVIRMVIFGFLGARLAYVSTHLGRFEDEWWKVIAIWEGGLALYGGLTVGAIVVKLLAHRPADGSQVRTDGGIRTRPTRHQQRQPHDVARIYRARGGNPRAGQAPAAI